MQGLRRENRKTGAPCTSTHFCRGSSELLRVSEKAANKTVYFIYVGGLNRRKYRLIKDILMYILLNRVGKEHDLWLDSYIFLMFLDFWDTETEREWGRGRDRGRQNPKQFQALRCQHRAWCRARTHKPGDHDLSRSRTLNQLSHPGAPWFAT